MNKACLLAATLVLAQAVAPAQAQNRARDAGFDGVYVTTLPLHSQAQSLPDRIYELKEIDGVYVRLVWRIIEPAAGAYDWSTLDRELARALRAGMKLSIGVRAGAYAPAWLYQQGVRKNSFVVGPHGGEMGRCDSIDLPSPWEPAYQKAYINMIGALAAHLRATPGAYAALRIVKITGINQVTEESRLPAGGGDPGKKAGACVTSNAVAEWLNAGYRPSKVVGAWNRMAEGVGAAFPDKLLAIEVLERNDFPPIDEAGRRTRPGAPGTDVKEAIIAAGLRRFPQRFAVQWDGLSAGNAARSVIDAGRRGAVVGWQTNQFKGLKGSGCDGDTVFEARECTEASYRAILERGVQERARYIEIWPPDAERFGSSIAAVRGKMR